MARKSKHTIATNIPVFVASAVSAKKSGLLDLSDRFLADPGSAPDLIKDCEGASGRAPCHGRESADAGKHCRPKRVLICLAWA